MDQKLDQNALQIILSQEINEKLPKIFWKDSKTFLKHSQSYFFAFVNIFGKNRFFVSYGEFSVKKVV